MEPRRKKVRVLSSTESHSSSEDDLSSKSHNRIDSPHGTDRELQRSCASGYDSGNSSVESMDYIMYPSKSVLLEIENSKSKGEKSISKDNKMKKLKDQKSSKRNSPNSCIKSVDNAMRPSASGLLEIENSKSNSKKSENIDSNMKKKGKKFLTGTSSKSEASSQQFEKEKNVNEWVERVSNDPQKLKRQSTELEAELTVQLEIMKKADTPSDKNKNKRPINQENMPDIQKTKKSTVKRRPESFGSRILPLMIEFDYKNQSHVNNKRQKKQNQTNKKVECKIRDEHKIYMETQISDQNFNIDEEFHETESKSLDSSSNECYLSRLNLIKIIVNLDTKWLTEKEGLNHPPPELSKGADQLPLEFESLEDYSHRYSSMLMLEIWGKIYVSRKANLNNKKKFNFSIESYEYFKGVMCLDCINKSVWIPEENSLVIVQLKLEDGHVKLAFGFIEKLELKNIPFDEGSKRQHKPVKQWFFKMIVKSRRMVTLGPTEGTFVCSLYKETKQAESLYLMKFSPLVKDFLIPTWDTFCTSPEHLNDGNFFNIQQNILDWVRKEINLSPSKPKIMLLEGPPGSGKTYAIAFTACNLLRHKEDPKKILIVAPSYSALDKIGKQLLKIKEYFNNPINFIRLGHIETIHTKLLYYSMQRSLDRRRISYKNNDKRRVNYHDEQQEKAKILSDISLILAVPEDCWELHKFGLKFSCCLMDEINQGTELDTLYPFVLDVKKFLLVADPMQLPADVKSEKAKLCGYQRSVTDRFQLYLRRQFHKIPTIILNHQFRMNSHIAKFPFQHFYPDREIKSSYADKRSIFYSFRPYIVLDDQCYYGTKDLPNTDASGVNLIKSLCSFIIDKDTTSSIGVIVPSEKEQKAYKAAMSDILNVEVGTVDHFQGQEKKAIILSCYKDLDKDVTFHTDYFRDKRKLNVALTRAVSSLIICGPIHKLKKYNEWCDLVKDSQNRGCYFAFKSPDHVQPSHLLKSSKHEF